MVAAPTFGKMLACPSDVLVLFGVYSGTMRGGALVEIVPAL